MSDYGTELTTFGSQVRRLRPQSVFVTIKEFLTRTIVFKNRSKCWSPTFFFVCFPLMAGNLTPQFFVFFRHRSRNRLVLTFCVSMKSECRGHHFFYIYMYIYIWVADEKKVWVSGLSKEILVDVACPWPDHMVLFSKSLKTFQVLPVERLNHKWKTNLSRFST